LLLLPILLLLITTLLIWIFRKRHSRMHWFLASIGILLAWVGTFLLGDKLPIELKFSIWEPEYLFATPLQFLLDEVTWPLSMISLTMLLVITLTLPSRDIVIQAEERITSIIYLILTFSAVLAGNMLSVLISWMLMDIFIFVLSMRASRNELEGSFLLMWFSKNLVSIFLLIIAAIINISKGGSHQFDEPIIGASVVIVCLSTLLRMPIHSMSKHGNQINWKDVGNMSLLDIFPALSGMSVLGHVIVNGVPDDAVLWFRIIGATYLAYYIFRLFLLEIKEHPRLEFYMGILGLGMLTVSYTSVDEGIMISAIGVILVLVSITMQVLEIHDRWHLIIPILFLGMLAGLPGTPGGLLSFHTASVMLASGSIGIAILVGLGMTLMAFGYMDATFKTPIDWKNSENLTRISYSIGLLLLVANVIMINFRLYYVFSLEGVIFFLSIVLAVGILYWIFKKFQPMSWRVSFQEEKIVHWISVFNPLRKMIDQFVRLLYGVGRIFESETGMLWAFVILMFLILALRKFGQ